jgi:hypothetical protein
MPRVMSVGLLLDLPTEPYDTNNQYIVHGGLRLVKLYKYKFYLMSSDERRWRNMRSYWTR